MTSRRRDAVVLLVVLVASTAAGPLVAADRSAGQDGSVLVVDGDGDADYATVQAAIDAASPGDTVRVRPGTYRENVTVDAGLRVVAPRGATLNGSTLDGTASRSCGTPAPSSPGSR